MFRNLWTAARRRARALAARAEGGILRRRRALMPRLTPWRTWQAYLHVRAARNRKRCRRVAARAVRARSRCGLDLRRVY